MTSTAARSVAPLSPGHVAIWRSGVPGESQAAVKEYTLLGPDRVPYLSRTAGQYGGHRAGLRYGGLDCAAAARALACGGYLANRVFFADEGTALAAGFRPCATCLPERYARWKSQIDGTRSS